MISIPTLGLLGPAQGFTLSENQGEVITVTLVTMDGEFQNMEVKVHIKRLPWHLFSTENILERGANPN